MPLFVFAKGAENISQAEQAKWVLCMLNMV